MRFILFILLCSFFTKTKSDKSINNQTRNTHGNIIAILVAIYVVTYEKV